MVSENRIACDSKIVLERTIGNKDIKQQRNYQLEKRWYRYLSYFLISYKPFVPRKAFVNLITKLKDVVSLSVSQYFLLQWT